jgi:mannose-6-phosphate isomerase-like protein (cupin superfamily)
MITIEEFNFFITQTLPYEEKIINVIDDCGRQITLDNFCQLKKYENKTIKIEGMEKFSKEIWDTCNHYASKYKHYGPVTCHVFRSFKDSISFPIHTDPCDILLYVIYGEKNIIIDGEETVIKSKESFYIPKNTPHYALNKKESIMLSFGLEDFFVNRI